MTQRPNQTTKSILNQHFKDQESKDLETRQKATAHLDAVHSAVKESPYFQLLDKKQGIYIAVIQCASVVFLQTAL